MDWPQIIALLIAAFGSGGMGQFLMKYLPVWVERRRSAAEVRLLDAELDEKNLDHNRKLWGFITDLQSASTKVREDYSNLRQEMIQNEQACNDRLESYQRTLQSKDQAIANLESEVKILKALNMKVGQMLKGEADAKEGI